MPLTLADLPADVRKYIADSSQEADGTVPSEAVLAAIGLSIGRLRDEAKAARVSSGIEDRWRDCEEAYAGIDDANRGEMGSQWTKSMSKDGPAWTTDDVPEANNRSTLYVRLTQRYVDAGSAKLGEILLAPGAKSFSFSATPVPDLINAKDDNRPVALDHQPGAPLAMRALRPGEAPPAPAASTLMGATALSPPPAIGASTVPAPAALPVPAPAGAVSPVGAAGPTATGPFPMGHNGGPAMVPITVADFAKEKAERADDAAKKAEKRVADWHVECRRTSQVRKVIFDAARLGVGVLKGPFPKSTRQMAARKGPDGIALGIRKVIQPASKWVNAWNFYPDPTCGEDIQDGDHVFEREWMGERQVRKLKELPGYITSQIDKVLEEGPQKVNVKDGRPQSPETDDASVAKKGKYETWYFHGTITREEMGCICEMAGPKEAEKFNNSVPPERKQVNAIVTMINDCAVKATINPLDSGEFPYHAMPWQRRVGSWTGVGVAEQISTPQRSLTAAFRSMMDNAGISGGSQIIIDTSLITPADGEMGMAPYKIWYLNGEGGSEDVNKAFAQFEIKNITGEMLELINMIMRLGEESTSIPLITQGQSGPTTPDTFGAAQLQNNNANQLLRSIGYTFDDHITEPETRQYYEYLILDPDVPDDEKGDWTIDAHGSSALVERALADQFLQQIGPLVLNPAYGANPKKWFELLVRSKQLQPTDLQYTEEEQARIDAQPPVAAPIIEVAKIRAATDAEALKTETANADKKLSVESTIALHEIKQTHEEAVLEYSLRHQMTIEQTKASLAKTVMEITAQERLNAQNAAVELHKHNNPAPQPQAPRKINPQRGRKPPVQAPGRAANGQSFSQSGTP